MSYHPSQSYNPLTSPQEQLPLTHNDNDNNNNNNNKQQRHHPYQRPSSSHNNNNDRSRSSSSSQYKQAFVSANNREVHSVADHYNQRPNVGRQGRQDSKIILMKNTNNWIKSVLISTYCKNGFSVFDLCGGKGGDMNKWVHGRISHLVLADVALVSVQHAVERYNQSQGAHFPAVFMAADCFGATLKDYLPRGTPEYDLVSLQFALHYSFETEERARKMLQNVTDRLKPGGIFLGTIPDSNFLVKRVKHSEGLSFGNSVYSVKFEQKEEFSKFGCRYQFFLEDAVNSVPEFLVHFPTLTELAAEYGLELVMKERFHDFYQANITNPAHKALFQRMKCVDEAGKISDDEWEAVGLYMVFAFKKKGEFKPNAPQPHYRKRHVTERDIIIVKQ